MLVLLRLLAAAGATASWIFVFIAVIIAVFVLYLGIALYATLHASDADQRQVRYQVFRDLLHWFDRGRRK
jgi:uncharacterized membrane protein